MSNQSVIVTGGRSPIALSIARRLSLHSNVILLTRDVGTFPPNSLVSNEQLLISELNLVDDLCIPKFNKLVKEYNVTKLCFAHRLSTSFFSPYERFLGEVLRVNEMILEFVKNRVNDEKRVVVLTSPASNCVVDDQDYIYHANKSALSALVRYFAVKYGSMNLAINAVAPGSFVSKERSKQFYLDNPSLFENIIKTIPSGKFTSPDDVSTYVEFLLEFAPMTINGTELILDSGLTLIEQSTLARKRI